MVSHKAQSCDVSDKLTELATALVPAQTQSQKVLVTQVFSVNCGSAAGDLLVCANALSLVVLSEPRLAM